MLISYAYNTQLTLLSKIRLNIIRFKITIADALLRQLLLDKSRIENLIPINRFFNNRVLLLNRRQSI